MTTTGRTLVALYDDPASAEAARDGLLALGLPRDAVAVHGGPAGDAAAAAADARADLAAAVMTDGERRAYAEGVRRGGRLVVARVPEGLQAAGLAALDRSGPVDVGPPAGGRDGDRPLPASWTTEDGASPRAAGERVRFEAALPEAAAAEAFRGRELEVVERAEEAVVRKVPRVVEEVGLRREVGERVEAVRDTVREQRVEVVEVEAEDGRGDGTAGRGRGP